MNGKQKKNQMDQLKKSISKIAKYMDDMKAETNEDVQFYNGMERAMSILEDRPTVFKKPPQQNKNTLKQKIKSKLMYIAFYFALKGKKK